MEARQTTTILLDSRLRSALGVFRIAISTYLFAQVATGIEVALAAVALVVAYGWPLHSALAVTIPLGFPVMLMQAALCARALTSLR